MNRPALSQPNGRGATAATNVAWNVAGQAAPLGAAVMSVPILLSDLGPARFGLLALSWAIVGYFSFFDLGMGRALTQMVAQRYETPGSDELGRIIGTAIVVMSVLGIGGGVMLAVLADPLARHVLKLPQSLADEATYALRISAAAIPMVVVGTGVRGVLEAAQRFVWTNIVRLPWGLATFIGPVIAFGVTHSLIVVVVVVVGARAASLLAYSAMCYHELRRRGVTIEWSPALALPLLRSGGWMTVSNVVGPIVLSADRFLVGAVVSVAAVAYYTTPYDLVTKLWIFPIALGGVVFPMFARVGAREGCGHAAAGLFLRAVMCVAIVVFPCTVFSVMFARQGMTAWLGPQFAEHSFRILQYLAIAVFVNSLAQMAFAFVQAVGRADWTGKLHIVEVPVYLAVLVPLLRWNGVEGVAEASLLRIAADALALFVMAARLVRVTLRPVLVAASVLGAALAMLCGMLYACGVDTNWGMAGAMLLIAGLGWVVAATSEARRWLRHRGRKRLVSMNL